MKTVKDLINEEYDKVYICTYIINLVRCGWFCKSIDYDKNTLLKLYGDCEASLEDIEEDDEDEQGRPFTYSRGVVLNIYDRR